MFVNMVAGGIIMDDYLLCFDVILIVDVGDDDYFEMDIFPVAFLSIYILVFE